MAVFTGEFENGKIGNIKLQNVVNAEGDSNETILELPGSGYVSNPVWSHDGKYVAFSYGDSRPGDPGDL